MESYFIQTHKNVSCFLSSHANAVGRSVPRTSQCSFKNYSHLSKPNGLSSWYNVIRIAKYLSIVQDTEYRLRMFWKTVAGYRNGAENAEQEWTSHSVSSKVQVKLSLCLTNYHTTKTYGGRGIAPSILNRSTRWRWVVRFTSQPLYPRGMSRRCPKFNSVLKRF